MKIFTITILFLTVLVLSACTPPPIATPGVAITATGAAPEPTQMETKTAVPIVYEPVTVKFAMTAHTSNAPLYFAEKEGYFEEFGIQIERVEVSKSSANLALFLSGDVDVYAGSLNSGLLNALASDPNLKVVAERGHFSPGTCTYQAIVLRKDLYESGEVTSPEDLKGLVIASTSAGPDAFILSTYLATVGLTLADVELNDIPNAGYIDAFKNKSLAAIVTPELNLSKLMNAGDAVILVAAQDVLGLYQVGVVAFNKNITVDHPDIGARFLAAYLKGVQQYNEGKTDHNLDVIAELSGEDIDLLRNSCLIPIDNGAVIDFEAVQSFQQWSFDNKFVDRILTEEEFWNKRFLDDAEKLLNP
jgi:NitT/TauT family transport system substrate-binding protein